MTDKPKHIAEHHAGNMQAIGGLSDKHTATAYVSVRLADRDRTFEWREVVCDPVHATSLIDAVKIVEAQEDVEAVLEASWIQGGVMT